MTSDEARAILSAAGAPLGGDYHLLSGRVVDALVAAADERKYRKPRNASGSRGRMFHDYLQRLAARRE